MAERIKKAIIYIHGKGGSAEEAAHYKALFPDREVIGFDYKAQTPWEAADEFPVFFDSVQKTYGSVSLIANSIGAFFALHALRKKNIEQIWLISPVINMERMITDMIILANTSEEELAEKKIIETPFGETLSWEYLCYVREHPISLCRPAEILCGAEDELVSYEITKEFAEKTGSRLTVMENGEHWFHTDEQMKFLDAWIIDKGEWL